MSDLAYSEELKCEISAIAAQKKSIKKELKHSKSFHCHDPLCGISLTCSNWNVLNANRIFFTPTNRNCLHSFACSTISVRDVNYQTEIETKVGKEIISNSGIIAMKKASESDGCKSQSNNNDCIDNKKYRNKNSSAKVRKSIEKRNIQSIKTFISFYYDDEINNDEPKFEVDKKIISLNTLFHEANEELNNGATRIFFGKAKLTTADFNSEMIVLKFVEGNSPRIFTNKKQLFKRISSNIIAKYLDKEKSANLYFRGHINKAGKFESFNGKFYCDLYILE